MLHFITYQQKYVILWAKHSCALLCQQATHSFWWEIQLAEQWSGFLCLVSFTHRAYGKLNTYVGFVNVTTCPKPVQHMAVFPNNIATIFSKQHSYNVFWWLLRFTKACTSLTWSTFPVAYPSWFWNNKHFLVLFQGERMGGLLFVWLVDLVLFCFLNRNLAFCFHALPPFHFILFLVWDPSSVLSYVGWDLCSFTADLR